VAAVSGAGTKRGDTQGSVSCARVVNEDGHNVPVGTIGRLAVQGPTGCRYLDDPRQADYVKGGWNVNIAAIEVEDVLLRHEAVAECAVIGVADQERADRQGVPRAAIRQLGDEAMVKALQDFVKARVAPYKYPRTVEFRDALPRTETGKLQRFRLRGK
jgi:2-aminobenzoate-CoA ligase